MGSAIFEVLVLLLAVWLVWRVMTRMIRPRGLPSEPSHGDYAGTPAKLRPKPHLGSGAVALEEPEEDNTDQEQ